MILRSVFLLLLTAVAGFGYTAIPERLQVGAYSVALRCNTHWSAQVHEREGVVRYDYVQHPVGIQFMVARVALPADAATVDEAVLAERLIRKNELKFHHTSFGQRVSFPRRAQTSEVPAGRAHVFGDDRPISRASSLRFAKAALLLPPDYRTRRVGFLITAHQAGGGDHAKLEQDDYFTELLTGLREEKNGMPAPAPASPEIAEQPAARRE